MDFNFNFYQDSENLDEIIFKLSNLEQNMSLVQDAINAAREEQNVVRAALASIDRLITEVKQLLSMGEVTGAQQLLDEIQANSQALVTATIENTAAANAVDAVNGDPLPPPAV